MDRAMCEAAAGDFGLPFGVVPSRFGTPAGCVRTHDGRMLWVETCAHHENCGTTRAVGGSFVPKVHKFPLRWGGQSTDPAHVAGLYDKAVVGRCVSFPNSADNCASPQLSSPRSSCEGVDQGENLGEFASPEACAVAAQQHGTGCAKFMFSSDYPSWGCRCCKQKTGAHQLWDMYDTSRCVATKHHPTCRVPNPSASYLLRDGNVCPPKLRKAGAGCDGRNQNLGEFRSVEACAATAQNRLGTQACPHIMFSSSYPSWGCRCCSTPSADHYHTNQHWNIYDTVSVHASRHTWQAGCGWSGDNLGEFASADACAATAQQRRSTCPYFMFSTEYPSWGCRCCSAWSVSSRAYNQYWDIYNTPSGQTVCHSPLRSERGAMPVIDDVVLDGEPMKIATFEGLVGSSSMGCTTAYSCAAAFMHTEVVWLTEGSSINFVYKSQAGSDWFETALVLYRCGGTKGTAEEMGVIVPATLDFPRPQCSAETAEVDDAIIMRGKRSTSFKTGKMEVKSAGNYLLGVFAASYDYSGGTWLGSKIFVKELSYHLIEGAGTSLEVQRVDPLDAGREV